MNRMLIVPFLVALKTASRFASAFQVSRIVPRRTANRATTTFMSTNANKKIDFSGLTDDLVHALARDLNLEKARKKLSTNGEMECNPMEEMTPIEIRTLLTSFSQSHPEAEKQVARLILKHLGMNKATFFGSGRGGSSGYESDSDVELAAPIPLEHSNDSDIVPNLSPVSWLSEESWNTMSPDEKLGFMEHVCIGFRGEHLLPFLRTRYYPTDRAFRVRSDAMVFGSDGVDRVILGHGPRRVLVLVGVHGNEPCGVEAVKTILQRKAIFTEGHAAVTANELLVEESWNFPLDDLFDSLTLEFLVGNPAALMKVSSMLTVCCNASVMLTDNICATEHEIPQKEPQSTV